MISVKTNKRNYRAEVFWYMGSLDVRIWNNGVIMDLHVETDMHRNLAEFGKTFPCCKAGKWNVYMLTPKSVVFLLANMEVTDSKEFFDRTNMNYGD